MAGEFTRSRPGAGHGGILGSALALAGALVQFLECRLALVAAESRTAAVQFLIGGICLVVALAFLGLGYVFLLVTGIVAIARLAGVSWLWIALIAAGLHFVCALLLFVIVRSKMTKPVFQETAAEFKKDRQWLEEMKEANRRTS